MKIISVHEAVGMTICHDITQIIRGERKEVRFKKGHIIKEEDIPVLLSLGKDNIYVWEDKKGFLHENEAAKRLKNLIQGKNVSFTKPKEGKIIFNADCNGLLKVNKELLNKINSIDQIIISTLYDGIPVKKGEALAATKVIPLVIDESKIKEAEKLVNIEKIISVKKYKKFNIGLIVTGNEVYHGRIKDTFGPVIEEKVKEYGAEIKYKTILDDNPEKVTQMVNSYLDKGIDMVICTGGMSVDPDDRTPKAIKDTGAEIISYGSPVLPGAMFLMSYKNNAPIIGLPGCAMYCKTTIFDLVLPRILAGEKIEKEDLNSYGYGGMCLGCDVCKYPYCSFGKGR